MFCLYICLWFFFPDEQKPCLSVATDPRGLLVVAGTTVGRFIVLNASTGMHMASIQAGKDQIDTLKFSPGKNTNMQLQFDKRILIF